MGDTERPEHDEWCESEFIVEAGGYTLCDCDNRNELRRRGFIVTRPDGSTPEPPSSPETLERRWSAEVVEEMGGGWVVAVFDPAKATRPGHRNRETAESVARQINGDSA